MSMKEFIKSTRKCTPRISSMPTSISRKSSNVDEKAEKPVVINFKLGKKMTTTKRKATNVSENEGQLDKN